MNISQSPSAAQSASRRGFLILLACLIGILGALFFRSFSPNQVIFSNDGPLGAISSEEGAMPGAYFGIWVTEGFDVGAIFSLFVAAFVLFQTFNTPDSVPTGKKLGRGFAQVVVVAVFAAFIATQAINTLVGTQVKGVVGVQQEEGTKK